jgi:hypothetical protein
MPLHPRFQTLKIRTLFAVLLAVSFASCEKEVHINLQSAAPRLVVQGTIETDSPPYVLLTSSVGFFSKVDLNTLENSFIHDAEVTVSNGTNTVTLKEYSFDTGGSFKFYVYATDPTLLTPPMVGENGKFYTLTIKHDGKTYTSLTKIPNPQGIDSMWFGLPEFAGDKTPDSARQMFVNYKDPDTLGDNVKYYTDRNNEGYIAAGNFNDEPVNGKQINNIGLYAGYVDNGSDRNRDSLVYFFPGEKVTLKWCSVDKYVYQFWNTLDFAKSAVGNPFSSPINPISNLTNGALGVWAGYGVYTKTLIVPHQ